MGRNLAFGVSPTIIIKKKKSFWTTDFDVLKNKEKILEELKDFIDISAYEIKEQTDKIVLVMKPQYFNENIHDLIKDIYPMMDCNGYMRFENIERGTKIKFDDKFNSENYPLELKVYEDGPDKGWIYCENYNKEDFPFEETSEWWIFKSKELKENVHIDKTHILLWFDINKIECEDETKMLGIMNRMSRTYLKSKLSRNSFFYISG